MMIRSTVDGKIIKPEEMARLWKFNKPKGFITSHKDERNRPTVFRTLTKKFAQINKCWQARF